MPSGCRIFCVALLAGLTAQIPVLSYASLVLVEDGRSRSVVVVADEAAPVAVYAAEELVSHIERATGARLAIVREAQAPEAVEVTRIYVGETRAATEQGLDAGAMAPDSYRLRVIGGDLFILGAEDDRDPLERPVSRRPRPVTRRGTLHGVYGFLERTLEVRWLWPGELGTYVPQSATLEVEADLDLEQAPALAFRKYRIRQLTRHLERGYDPDIARLAFSESGLKRYHQALVRYLLVHQEGDTEPQPPVGHYFQGWWNRYGAEHPEWFAMRDDGERGPAAHIPAYRVRMCVSNRELQEYIVDQVWDGGDVIPLGESDHRHFCRCDDCMALDAPQPDSFGSYSATNRYVRFWKAVRDRAAERNPDVQVTTFLYMDFTHSPTIDIDLTGIYGEFVPWGSGFNAWYPKPEEEHEFFKREWRNWQQSGVTMAYRPNYLLGGYVMPHLSTWQVGDMLKFAAGHGMTGFDYDSLWAHWAVKGPMLYMHMRLGTDPSREIGDIRAEYFSAFGPASEKVEAYFDYWEAYSAESATGGGPSWSSPGNTHEMYSPESFVLAEQLLEQALTLARGSNRVEYGRRVAFLQAGLEHAKKASTFTRLYAEENFEAARDALLELVEFRRENEDEFISDYTAAAFAENRGFRIDALLSGDFPDPSPRRPQIDLGNGWLQPWSSWYYRKDRQDAGIGERWYEPEQFDAADWTEVQVPSFLSATAVGPYLGYGWYATAFEVPEGWQGDGLEILFESVDEQAWVYLNGVQVGEHSSESEGVGPGALWDAPFIVSVDAAQLKPGRENWLVVRTHAHRGESGIWKPVRIRQAFEPWQ